MTTWFLLSILVLDVTGITQRMIPIKWGMSILTVGSSLLHCEAFNPSTNYLFVSRKISAPLGLHNPNFETSNALRAGGSPTFGALQIEEREIFWGHQKST